jgi:P4 family phage/plasmid primase-like protien
VDAVRLYVIGQVQAATQAAIEMQAGAQDDLAGWTKLLSAGRLRAITGLAKAIVRVPDEALDADPDLLNCPNGIVDLRSGVLLDSNPDRLMTRICGVDYDPTARDEGWDKILLAMDEGIVPWMQVRMGQAATGYRTPDDRVPLLQGTGNNGKTTYTAGISGALGTYHQLVPDGLLLGKAQRDESMTLRGARYALMEETPQGAQLSSVMLKKATSPEMEGHHLYASTTTWTTSHSLFITTNYRPVVTETDDGTWRRLALVVFPYRYVSHSPDPEQNERLGDGTLRARVEMGDQDILRAALAWVVAGARLWYAAGGELPDVPEPVAEATRRWRLETDLVLAYIEDSLKFEFDRHVRSSDVLMDFNDWLESRGHHKWSDRVFSQAFGSHDEIVRRKVIKKKFPRPGEGLSELGIFDRKGGQFSRVVTPSYWAWVGLRFGGDEEQGPDQDRVPAVPAENKVPQKFPHGESLDSAGTAGTALVSPPVAEYGEDPFGSSEPSEEIISAPKAMIIPQGTVAFDIETPSASELFTFRSRPGVPYARLNGLRDEAGQEVITQDPAELIKFLEAAPSLSAHNGLRFDLMALAYHHGADYDALAAKTWDTYVDATVLDPPGSKGQKPWSQEGYYGLDQLAGRLGLPGKTDHLPALAREYAPEGLTGKAAEAAGYGLIPPGEPRYNAYLSGDLSAQAAVHTRLTEGGERMAYRRREQRVAYLQNRMTLSGWKVNVPLLEKLVKEEQEKVRGSLEWLHENAGVPLTKTVGTGRGKNRTFREEPVASPLTTTVGREAIIDAFAARGLPYYLKTESGALALSKDALGSGSYMVGKGAKGQSLPAVLNPARRERHPDADWTAIEELCEHIKLVTTSVQKYKEVQGYLIGDRVHAHVGETQGSRRWAMIKPSLTNMGKRGGKVVQRAPMIADDGCLLVAFDFDQVDMRAFAGHCGDPAYVDMFVRGEDPHSMIADMVFGRHDGDWRDRAKASGHGWNYGLSVNGLVNSGIERTLAERFDAGMNEGYPQLCSWRTEVRERAAAGELLDNGFGALMRCDPARAWTQAPALMGQGTARDIMVEGLLRLPQEYVPWLRGVVHDEAVFNVPEERVEECVEVVTAAFTMDLAEITQGRLHSVPITTGASRPAKSWNLCYAKD